MKGKVSEKEKNKGGWSFVRVSSHHRFHCTPSLCMPSIHTAPFWGFFWRVFFSFCLCLMLCFFFCFLFVAEKDHDLDLCSYPSGHCYHHNRGSSGDILIVVAAEASK